MKRHAIIKNGVVVNVCLWDGDEKTWKPDPGTTAVLAEDGGEIGQLWDGERFSDPPDPQPVEQPKSEVERLVEHLVKKGVMSPEEATSVMGRDYAIAADAELEPVVIKGKAGK